MRINTANEKLIALADAAQLVPRRNGRKIHISTLYRWSTVGCRGVVLETFQAGASRATSREAVARFFAKLTEQRQQKASGGYTTKDVNQDSAVERELKKLGL